MDRSILFASNRDATPVQGDGDNGRYALYAMAVDGRGLRQLTRPGPNCSDEYPAPSPSGSRIAFLRTCGQSTDLWMVSSDGRQTTDVAGDVDDAAWSPDGRSIAFTRPRDTTDPMSPDDLFVLPASGGSARLVAKGDTTVGFSVGSFAWSHDGTRIAFGCRGGWLCAAGVEKGARTIRRLHHFSSGDDVYSVAWSPDDRELAVVDGSGGSYDPDYSAWVMAADGKHAHRLPRHGEGNVDAVAWLPEHPQVLVINTDYAKAYLMRADGTGKHDLPFAVDTIAPSLAGDKALFVRRVFDSDGNYDRSAISLANLKTGQVQQLTQRH
jgi:Tol biopolymer transport system component